MGLTRTDTAPRRRLTTIVAATAVLVLCELTLGCATTAETETMLPVASAGSESAVVFQEGDDAVQAALLRVLLAGDSNLIARSLEGGAFNDTLSDSEAQSFLDLAQQVEVEPGAVARDPHRGARRLIYAMLAARVIAKGTWSEADAWFDRAASDHEHWNDITAGFAVTDWWPSGDVARARDESELDAWRAVFERMYAGSDDVAARRRLIRNAHGKLGLLPGGRAEPETARQRAARYIERLLAIETDDVTRAALLHALDLTGFAAPDGG
jgi:hypothetical protein